MWPLSAKLFRRTWPARATGRSGRALAPTTLPPAASQASRVGLAPGLPRLPLSPAASQPSRVGLAQGPPRLPLPSPWGLALETRGQVRLGMAPALCGQALVSPAQARVGRALKCLGLLVLVLGPASCASRGPRPLTPMAVQEFPVPWANAFPSDAAVDETGRVWFTDRLVHVIGVFDPATGQFDSIRTPTPNPAPYGLLRAPDGSLWYGASNAGKLGRVELARRRIEEYEIGGASGGPHLIAWRDGTIWFSLREGNAFGRYDTRTKATRVYAALEQDKPYSVAVAPNGHVWFDVLDGWRLYEVNPRTDSVRIHELATPPAAGQPWGMYAYRDSVGRLQTRMLMNAADTLALDAAMRRLVERNRVTARARRLAIDRRGVIWVADHGRARVLRYDPRTGETAVFPPPAPGQPYTIAAGPSGNILFSALHPNRIVILDPQNDTRTIARIPTAVATVRHLYIDEERQRIWLPLSDGGRIGLLRFSR